MIYTASPLAIVLFVIFVLFVLGLSFYFGNKTKSVMNTYIRNQRGRRSFTSPC